MNIGILILMIIGGGVGVLSSLYISYLKIIEEHVGVDDNYNLSIQQRLQNYLEPYNLYEKQ